MIINLSKLQNLGYHTDVKELPNGDECLIVAGTMPPSDSVLEAVQIIAKYRETTDQQTEQIMKAILAVLVKIDVGMCTQ